VSLTESGTSSIASAWDRYAMAYQSAARLSTDVISYGPGALTEAEYRLLGPVQGKRVLDLGCGGAQSAIALAKQGAIAIGVDISVEQLAYARRLMEDEEVRVELKHGDLAELAFQRADSVDIVFSASALQYVPDLNRVFRQVHRVLKPQGAFVFSIPHPVTAVANTGSSTLRTTQQLSIEPDTFVVERSYFDKSPIEERWEHVTFTEYHRPTSEIFMGLVRSGYRVDVLLEPEGPQESMLPQILIVRARKEA
jgi:ubiquinone/menaquinone biosynthesis C-methylase UbiE